VSIGSNFIPEKINDANVYLNGNRMIGVASEVELPEINMMTSKIEGMGIGGEIDSPTLGQFESLEATLKFNTLFSSIVDILDPLETNMITVRAAQQVFDKTGGYAFKGLRAVLGGRPKQFKPGKVQKGEAMEAEVTMECTYYLLEVDGKSVVEVDKLNAVYKVNGRDILAGIAALT